MLVASSHVHSCEVQTLPVHISFANLFISPGDRYSETCTSLQEQLVLLLLTHMFFPYHFYFSHFTLLHQVFRVCNPTPRSCQSRHQTDRLMTAKALPPLLILLLLLHHHQRFNKCNVALSSLTLTAAGSGYHGILTSDAVGTVAIRSENALSILTTCTRSRALFPTSVNVFRSPQ